MTGLLNPAASLKASLLFSMFPSIGSFNHPPKRIGGGPLSAGAGHPKKHSAFIWKRPLISSRHHMDLGYTSDSDVWRSNATTTAAAAVPPPPRARSLLKPPLSAIDAPSYFTDLDGGIPTVARQQPGRPRWPSWHRRRGLGDHASSMPYGHTRRFRDSTESLISVMVPETQPPFGAVIVGDHHPQAYHDPFLACHNLPSARFDSDEETLVASDENDGPKDEFLGMKLPLHSSFRPVGTGLGPHMVSDPPPGKPSSTLFPPLQPRRFSSLLGHPHPHHRHGVPPPFLPRGYSTSAAAPMYQPTHPGERPRGLTISTSVAANARCVRWNENLICPSPIHPSQRRKGWFNRRGDQLWTNNGAFKPPSPGREYPPDLAHYPDPGHGWMNEEGVRIDVGHHFIPKMPLRSALKKTSSIPH